MLNGVLMFIMKVILNFMLKIILKECSSALDSRDQGRKLKLGVVQTTNQLKYSSRRKHKTLSSSNNIESRDW